MSEKIVNIGDMRLRRKGDPGRWNGLHLEKPKCRHLRTTLDPNGHIITCDDCNMQVDAFWVLGSLIECWSANLAALQAQTKALQETRKALENENIHLIAARKVESVWRSRNYVPACPHCAKGILPEDGLGSSRVSRRRELERRK